MANLIEYIQSQVYENSTEDISGSIMQQVLTRMASDEGVVNVHTISGQTPFADYNNAQAARDAVPDGFKKLGLIITYKLSSGWYVDEFIGSATSGWSTASNWKCLGPISVTQNASTGKTTITIGSESFDVATQPVSVSQNTLTIGGTDVGELAGQLIENPEWVQVVTDSQGKILYGVKNDGKFYFGDGCPPQVVEYVTTQLEELEGDFTTLLNAKVDKVTGKSLIDAEFATSQEVITNPEYLQVTTDSENKVLEGIKEDGTKVIGDNVEIGGKATVSGGATIHGKVDIQGVIYTLQENPEWIKVLTDAQDRIIAGIRKDGSVYINKIVGVTDALEEIKQALGVLRDYVDEQDAQINAKIDYDERETVPSYYFANGYLQNKVDSIINIYRDCAANGDIFFFSTDEHWEYNAKRSPALVKYITERIRIDKLFSGGDNTQLISLGGTSNKQNPAVDDFLSLREKTFKGKLYYAIGNHEYLTGYFDNPNLFDNVDMNNWHDMTRFSGLDEIVYGDSARHYYYVDNKQKKIRYIFISAFKQKDVQHEEQGYRIIAEADYNDSQVAWLRDEALNVESGWTMVVITHCLSSINPIISEGHCTEVIRYLSEDSKKIAKVLLQYEGDGEIAAVISGHLHADGIAMIDDNYVGLEGAEATGRSIPEIVTTCDTGGVNGFQQWVLYGDYFSRSENTITEQAFEVVIVDKNLKKISLVRIGAPAYNIFEQDVETGYYPLSGDIEIREVNYGQA